MDFSWNEEEESFRQEILGFLKEYWLQPEEEGEGGSGRGKRTREFRSKLKERGWNTIAWPTEYGGMGWSTRQQFIFNEEMALHKAPAGGGNGLSLAGPVIINYGTGEQKQRFLPPIARGEAIWCQLFSEPNAGSDLASLQTKAEDMGDYFLLNGSKIWTSGGHLANWGILLARTDQDAPKHKGISYFLLDMSLPGITSRPIMNMADVHHFNEFFFDNVRIPRDCLVGEKNSGWYVAAATLNFERSGVGSTISATHLFEDLVAFAKEGTNGFNPLKANPVIRHKMADMAIQLKTARMLAYRVYWLQSTGQVPSYEASISKMFASEMTQRLVGLGMELLGHWGELTNESPVNALRGKVEKLYRGQRAITIGAGTSEVQRNTIATRGLGLPRG